MVVAVGLAFGAGIPAGFVLRPKLAWMSDDAFGAILGIGIPVIAIALYCLFTGAFPKPRPERWTAPGQEEAMARIASEQQAYASDTQATAACEHLRPVEAAMRAAGVRTQLLATSGTGRAVWALCQIHEQKLRHRFGLPSFVEYVERYVSERSREDTPHAELSCRRCMQRDLPGWSMIVLHPVEGGRKYPWFPEPPPDRQ